MEKMNNICTAMKRLQKEQNIIAKNEVEFQFVRLPSRPDTIPFMLFDDNGCQFPFSAICMTDEDCFRTQFFRLERLNEETCCAVLSLLKAVDMDGCLVNSCDEIYSLMKTKCCVHIDLSCFCVISPLSIELVNRTLPIIEPKC